MDREPKNIRSEIFRSTEKAVEWCIKNHIISNTLQCKGEGCKDMMTLYHDTSYKNRFRYRCKGKSCRKSESILERSWFKTPNIPLNESLLIVYLWLKRLYTFNLESECEVSPSSILRVKKNIYKVLTKENKRCQKKIGGFEHIVQTDETVIVKSKLYTSPSSMYDTMSDTTWLVGSIDEDTRELILEIVPNRSGDTMIKYFKKNIKKETLCLTDGHKSYPKAVSAIKGEHHVVIHEEGFKNEAGETTNLIECVWALLKYEIKVKKGVKKSNLLEALEEFKWRHRCIKIYNGTNVRHQFFNIVCLFFNK
ncbi:hypothetical protein DMUE_5977 [Dictyocoela muelleri]|nr:hypothetical protein DMUE_5977 [Dictyocoela muelleri]